jgi:hypothetical protein
MSAPHFFVECIHYDIGVEVNVLHCSGVLKLPVAEHICQQTSSYVNKKACPDSGQSNQHLQTDIWPLMLIRKRSADVVLLLVALCATLCAAAQQWQDASTAAKYALGSMMRPGLQIPGREYFLAQGFRGVEYPRNYNKLAQKLATPGMPDSSSARTR